MSGFRSPPPRQTGSVRQLQVETVPFKSVRSTGQLESSLLLLLALLQQDRERIGVGQREMAGFLDGKTVAL